MSQAETSSFATIHHRGRALSLEYRWLNTGASDAPLLLFLHEGLGSVALWRDFPARLCAASGCRGLVYSRPGYGRSTPRPPDERWTPDFLEQQALEVLPAFLAAVGVDLRRERVVLFGHSDGASIALIHAVRHSQHLAGPPSVRRSDQRHQHRRGRRGLRRRRPPRTAGALPRRRRFGVLGLEPDLARSGVSRLEHRSTAAGDRLPGARRAGRRRRVRNDGADRRHRSAGSELRAAEARRLRSFAASRPAASSDHGGACVAGCQEAGLALRSGNGLALR